MTRWGFTVVLTLFLLAVPALASGASCTAPTVKITSEAISDSDERDFEAAFRKAVAKVCAWWGPAFTGAFTIRIEDSRGPSMSLVPSWRDRRGTMLFRARVTSRGQAAITHEVVHVFAPNANRFLAEGLAVYAHEHLGGQPAYPNFGDDLHRAAKQYVERAEFSSLDRVATPRRLKTSALDGREAYIVAGSFVRFLIETYGMEKFRRLYARTPLVPHARNAGDPARWNEVYGKTLEDLGREWKARIAA